MANMTGQRNQDVHALSQQMLYPLQEPDTAFRNAMKDLGVNPYRSNPFITQLQKAAQGSRVAFLMSGGGMDNPSETYGSWLREHIGGGNLISDLQNYASGMGGAIEKVRDVEKRIDSGEDVSKINPYVLGLRDIFNADNGQGALAAYASMRTPLMGALGSPYAKMLRDYGETAQRNFAQNATLQDDVWKYIFNNWSF